MYTQKKVKSGYVTILFLLATVILFIFHTLPSQKENSALSDKADKLKAEVSLFSEQKEELAPRGQLSEVEQKELDKAIPQNIEQDIIISDINNLAKKADVSFNALTFSLQKGTAIPSINISAGFQGTSANIVRFLKMMETNPRKLVVKDAGISRAQTDTGLDIVNLSLSMSAFYRTPQQGEGKL